jgi:putative ABC transport system permease protein
MNYFEFIKISYRSLSKNKVRSLLTMLGIIIGVFSVIAMLALGQGSKQSIQDQIQSMGTNVVMIFPGAQQRGGVMMDPSSSQKLDLTDVNAVKTRSVYIKYTSPTARKSGQAVANNKNWRTQVQGIYPEYFQISNYKVKSGDMFTDQQEKNSAKVCIIGKTVLKNLFGEKANPIGQMIRIDKIPLKIMGIMEEKGSNTFGQDQDDVIMAPFSTVQKRMLATTYVQQIIMSAKSEKDVQKAVKEVEQIIRENKKLGASDTSPFTIRTQAEFASMMSSVSNTLIILLAGIASISLLVGGIGIMNIMLVSVTERTREIGLRMSVGARSRDILRQFLLEAIMLSFLGGFIGVILGILVALGLGNLIGMAVAIKLYSVLLSFFFASMVGVFFGWYPARKAASLIPVDALRYE